MPTARRLHPRRDARWRFEEARPPVVTILRKPLVPAVLVSAVLLICLTVAGCSAGGDRDTPDARPTPTQPSVTSNTPTVQVKASAQGDSEAGRKRASSAATKELEDFLGRYLAVAFAPSAAVTADGELAKFFDPGVRGQLGGNLSALSLGAAGARTSAVRTNPATATVDVLAAGGRPAAGTVKLAMNGMAVTDGQPVEISLRATFQMLRGRSGWSIVAYDSQAKGPA
jgi:hypothetical protein